MPYGTIELPQAMIDAASAYAKRERMSVPSLFADLLRQRYGFVMTVTVAGPASQRRPHADAGESVSCPPRRQPGVLRGQIRISPDFDAPLEELEDLFENSSI